MDISKSGGCRGLSFRAMASENPNPVYRVYILGKPDLRATRSNSLPMIPALTMFSECLASERTTICTRQQATKMY